MALEVLAEHRCFAGVQGYYRHQSLECHGPMRFSVFRPPQAGNGPLPVLFFLAGLTCTEEPVPIKPGAQRLAAELGLILIAPDTSPRDTGFPGATGDWEFGEGAGFWLDAMNGPWATRFRMESWVVKELRSLAATAFGADLDRCGIFGHSMGGHGALILALKYPHMFKSVSAFAPIVAPTQVPWGQKALPRYLGDFPHRWAEHDTCELLRHRRTAKDILVDQGLADKFLETQLQPERLEAACAAIRQPLTLRRHAGYDHGYYFIQSFIDDHLRHHAATLCR